MQNTASLGPRILKVVIRGLYGIFDYDIPSAGRDYPLGNVTVLYGDNGCGKTTILNLIFHLISSSNTHGHRNRLLEIPFRRVEVKFSDGTSVAAYRRGASSGPYNLSIHSPGQKRISGSFIGESPHWFDSAAFEKRFIERLSSLGLTLFLLADDRKIHSDVLPREARQERVTIDERTGQVRAVARTPGTTGLDRTIELTQEWMRTQALKASTQGSLNANAIYLDLIDRLLRAHSPSASLTTRDLHTQLQQLRLLVDRSNEYARYGFVPPLRLGPLLQRLRSMHSDKRDVLNAVLEPFVSGLRARLDSLNGIHQATALFVRELNEFYATKDVRFQISSGFEFIDSKGRKLNPQMLSSGERHLLMLFCYTLISRDKPSLFIVDEPELSLNVKWQRSLISALSELVSGSGSQFLFATHSVEILAQHRRAVVHLGGDKAESPRSGVA